MALSKGSKVFLVVMLLVVLLVAGGVITLGAIAQRGDDGGEPVVVEIPEGASASTVGDILAEEGVIRFPLAFKIAARFDERASRIGSGTYRMRTGMGTDKALEELASDGGRIVESFRVTIPEGRTVTQTLEHISEAEGSPFTVDELEEAIAGVPLPDWVPSDIPDAPRPYAAYEGLLFPDTYEFRADADAQDVLDRLVERTEEIMDDIEPPEGMDRHEVLVMASLIEREARVPDEQRKISAVMHNRLEEPMRLQIDATVIYAKGEEVNRVLTSDLQIQSPWNTYVTDGLPPTPISGAGESAIEAAANPAESDFLYYVVSDRQTGEHAFAETLSEHNENVARYREQRAAEQGGG